MQSSLQISRRVDYALRATICMAELPEGRVVSFREIAAHEQIPEDFLAKILRSLVKNGIARSIRGPHGGYGLARAPSEITFLDVIEAADGPIQINTCLSDDHDHACVVREHCSMYGVWSRAQESMLSVFRSTSIDDVIRPERVCENLIRYGSRKKRVKPTAAASSNQPG